MDVLDKTIRRRIIVIIVAMVAIIILFNIGSTISKKLTQNRSGSQSSQSSVDSADQPPVGDEEADLVEGYPNYAPDAYEGSRLISSSSTALDQQQSFRALYTVKSTTTDVFYYYQDALSELKGYHKISQSNDDDSAQISYAKDDKGKDSITVDIVTNDDTSGVSYAINILEKVKK